MSSSTTDGQFFHMTHIHKSCRKRFLQRQCETPASRNQYERRNVGVSWIGSRTSESGYRLQPRPVSI